MVWTGGRFTFNKGFYRWGGRSGGVSKSLCWFAPHSRVPHRCSSFAAMNSGPWGWAVPAGGTPGTASVTVPPRRRTVRLADVSLFSHRCVQQMSVSRLCPPPAPQGWGAAPRCQGISVGLALLASSVHSKSGVSKTAGFIIFYLFRF